MSHKPIAILGAAAAAAVALLAIAAIAAPGKVEQDATFYQLDARYHQLPQSLVDRLMKDPPPAPRYSTYWCFGPKDTTEEGTGYCVCWGDAACRELANLGVCEAKLGIIRPGTGVCRSQAETVIVG